MNKTFTVVQVNARTVGNSTVTFGQFDEKGVQVPRTDGVVISFKDAKEATKFIPGDSYEISVRPAKKQ